MTFKMLDVLKGFPTMAVRAVQLSKRTLEDPEDARGWLVEKGLDFTGDIVDHPGAWHAEIRPTSEFVAGSDRSIVLEGGVVKVGLLAGAVAKGGEELLEIALDKLTVLTSLDLVELTLTSRPALGDLANFQVIKSLDTAEPAIRKSAAFVAKNEAERIVYGHPLLPDLPDWQGDIVPMADVEKGAHSLLINIAKGKAKGGEGTGVEHTKFGQIGHIVESSVDKSGAHGIPGAWFVGVKITNDEVWKSIQNGELKGFSVGGKGQRAPLLTLDGVLKAKYPTDVAKAEQSLEEMRSAVSLAIRLSANNEYDYAWIDEIYLDRVVYRCGGKLYMASYTLDADGKATLAGVVEARREYVAKGGPDWSTPPTDIAKAAAAPVVTPPTPVAPPPTPEPASVPIDVDAVIAKRLAPIVARLEGLETVAKSTPAPVTADVVKALEDKVKGLQGVIDALPVTKSKAAPVDAPVVRPVQKGAPKKAHSPTYGPNYDEAGNWIGDKR